jgi:hypothetical protein
MPVATPSNDDEHRPTRPLMIALGLVIVLTFVGALVGGVVVVLRYGIASPLLNAPRDTVVAAENSENENDPEPASETTIAILPFEPPDAGATSTFPLPEEFAALLDPIDAAIHETRVEEPVAMPVQDQAPIVLEEDHAPIEAPPKEDPQPSTVASETLTPTPSQEDDEPVHEPSVQVPAQATPDYWVFPATASRPSVFVVPGNHADQPPLVYAGLTQSGFGAPPAPMFTTPPAPMFTTPPAPMFTAPPAPGFTTPPAPMFTAPPAPGFTTPPAPAFSPPTRESGRPFRGRR